MKFADYFLLVALFILLLHEPIEAMLHELNEWLEEQLPLRKFWAWEYEWMIRLFYKH